MKALVYEGAERLVMRDVPMPVPAPDEELIRIEAAGICGSDMHAYQGHDARRPAPLILGHESAGTIAAGPHAGRRVTINPLVTCGRCAACKAGRENLCAERQILSMQPRAGTFARYVAVPSRNLITVPDHVDLQRAALAEPLAVSWHAARLGLAALPAAAHRAALVLGGGAIGLAACLALSAMGVAQLSLVEPNALRAEALRLPLGDRVTGKAAGAWPLIIDAVGIDATRATASALTEPGGVIVHIGLGSGSGGLDIRRMTLQEIAFVGSYTYTARDFSETAHALFDGRLGKLDWHVAQPLDAGPQAFADLLSEQVAPPKIMLLPWA